ncbi:HPF/RaiA family ribosome-associated protein [Deminuibacter soli]|uniref:HPF/RaiA family ribosome-associated protein n=1 Tax=Deminuibacter soli TaxID=2291815 RepID=A0A3E1NM65_9BACT|nr:HPF/RaiA family ribosome-associated protein [Deminuibacter soli]RFM29020.1 HPF/RaiA family ribosome-associated protein [Deminuibacter soli]
MEIIIQSLGFKAGDSLETFVKDKLNTLKSDRIVSANVTLYKGPDSDPESNYCEIRLEAPGNDPFVKKQGAHFETAISECVEVLTQMLQKSKDKQSAARKAESAAIQDALLEGEDESDGTEPELEDVVK